MQINQGVQQYTNWRTASVDKTPTVKKTILNNGVERTPLADSTQVEKAIKSLTEEQKKMLRDKYNIQNMELNSPEHEALMKELRDLGAISDSDYTDSANPIVMIDFGGADFLIRRIDDLPPWDMENVGDDIYKYYFHGQDGFMESYGKIIANKALPFDEMMKFADTQLNQAGAFGRIADVLKDIFM